MLIHVSLVVFYSFFHLFSSEPIYVKVYEHKIAKEVNFTHSFFWFEFWTKTNQPTVTWTICLFVSAHDSKIQLLHKMKSVMKIEHQIFSYTYFFFSLP